MESEVCWGFLVDKLVMVVNRIQSRYGSKVVAQRAQPLLFSRNRIQQLSGRTRFIINYSHYFARSVVFDYLNDLAALVYY